MAIRGKIKNGKVLLNKPTALTDGTEVEVRPVKKPRKPAKAAKAKRKKIKPRPLSERFASFMGQATGLPPDASINHDHYIYGIPKRQ